MKFIINTSAVAVSDTKFAKQGEYETEDLLEIERLRFVAKEFPKDVLEVSIDLEKKEEAVPPEKAANFSKEENSDEKPKQETRHRR